MRGTFPRSVLLAAAFAMLAGCDELMPAEPEAPAPVVAKPVKKQTAAPAPVPVKKKPVIVFEHDNDDGGGGGWGG